MAVIDGSGMLEIAFREIEDDRILGSPVDAPKLVRGDAHRVEMLRCIAAAMGPVENLDQSQYKSLHATGYADSLQSTQNQAFMVERIGCSSQPNYADDGIEYYRFVRDDGISA